MDATERDEPVWDRRLAALTLAGLAFAVVAAGLQLERLTRLEPRSFDLAIYAQIVWNAGHGDLTSSIQQAPALGVHWSPVLLVLAPLARLGLDPVPLLVGLQALALGAVAPLLYLGLKGSLGPERAGVAAGLALLYPPLWTLALADVHPVTLGVPACLALFVALDRGRPRLALGLALTLGLLVHEVYPLVLVGLGLFLLVERRGRLAVAFLGLGLGLFVLESMVLLPRLRGAALDLEVLYGHLGDGPAAVALSPLLRPGAVLRQVATWGHAVWILGLLLPLLALPLLRPALLLPALPVLALHALSIRATQQDLLFHYHAPLVPWLLLAAGRALAVPRRRGPLARVRDRLNAWLAAGSLRRLALLLGVPLAAALVLFPEPRGAFADAARAPDPRTPAARARVAAVPAAAPAAGSVDVLHALARRPGLWGLPAVIRGTKDWSRVPYAPPPGDAWVVAEAGDDATFWPALPPGHPAAREVAQGAARWRAVALAPGRGVRSAVEGLLVLGPGGRTPVAPADAEPPSDGWAMRGVEPEGAPTNGVRPVQVLMTGPAGRPAPPLVLEATYRDAEGELLRRVAWPALYRLYDHTPWPAPAVAVRAGLLDLGAEVELRLRLGDARGPYQGGVVRVPLR